MCKLEEQRRDIGFTTLAHCQVDIASAWMSSIAEFLRKSSATTATDGSMTQKRSVLKQKLPKTSVRASASKEKDYTPYWNESSKEKLVQLQSFIGIGYADSPLICLPSTIKPVALDSWFTIKEKLLQKSTSSMIWSPSQQSLPVVFAETENTVIRAKRIRIYPPKDQKAKLLRFFGVARYYYNKTVAFLRQPDTKANRFDIQKDLLADKPEWAEDVPYKIRQMAIDDACLAVKAAKKKYASTQKFHSVGFRSKRDRQDSFYVPKDAVRPDGIFPRSFKGWHVTEKIDAVEFDCRMIHDKGKFWLCVPFKKKILKPENQRRNRIALDPGVRTFLTACHEDGFIHFGENDFQKIFKILLRMDKMLSRRHRKYRKAIDRCRFRVVNLVDEMHRRVASWLCKTFEVIVIPPFAASTKMMNKLRSKTCRSMLTWAHARFDKRLQEKAVELSCVILSQNEAYTSKTCSACGTIHNIGSRKTWQCLNCQVKWDRDENAARGILLRALVDQPSLMGLSKAQGCSFVQIESDRAKSCLKI